MANTTPVIPPYITKEKLIELANNFLSTYNSSSIIPVPIEDIVELSLGITVIPVPNLKRAFTFESFISSDFKNIIIDGYIYDTYEDRTRFTYAHELAHFILHKDFYKSQDFSNIQEYLEHQNSQSDQLLKRIESQAYLMAGYLLMPQTEFREIVDRMIKEAGGSSKLNPLQAQAIIDTIGDRFFVSPQCVQKQFIYEYGDVFEILKKIV